MSDQKTLEIKKQIEDANYRRYALSVVAGQEHLVVENLKERAEKHGLEESIIDFLVPAYNETKITKTKKTIREKKLFP